MNKGGNPLNRGMFSRWLVAPSAESPGEAGQMLGPERSVGGAVSHTRVTNYDRFNASFRAPNGPDDIQPISEDTLRYIEEGHGANAAEKYQGNSELPSSWRGEVLRAKVQQVIDNPQDMRQGTAPKTVDFLGLVDGVPVRVPVRDTEKGWQPWAVWTAYPDHGAVPGL